MAALAAVLAIAAAPAHADPGAVRPLRRDVDAVFIRLVSQIAELTITDPAQTGVPDPWGGVGRVRHHAGGRRARCGICAGAVTGAWCL